jgi:hypothetical protein
MMKAYDSLKPARGKISFQEAWGVKKFGQKFVFEQKFARKNFLHGDTTMIGIQIWFSD